MTASRSAGTDVTDDLGLWVREWRHSNRLTQERLAEALGYEVSYVAKIERGDRRPSAQFLARLADVTKTAKGDLLRATRRQSDRVRLPVPEAPLFGREDTAAAVRLLLDDGCRCVTLVGPPGIGKTSLAIEVAWQAAHGFRHGACFVPLAEVTSSGAVASAIAHRLGLRDRADRPAEEQVVEALAARTTLLLLDNFEHLLPESGVVERLCDEAPGVQVIVTSREALGLPLEALHPVGALEYPDPSSADLDDAESYAAVRVFVARARLARPGFELTDANRRPVVEICAHLEGVPLGINVTAAGTRMLSPADIARSIRERMLLPTAVAAEALEVGAGPGAGFKAPTTLDLLGRDRLGSALDWSWALLEPTSQRLLARLGIFSGGWNLEAARHVCGEDGDDVLAGLTDLEQKSLVQAAPTDDESRFTVLETVREYALAQLDRRSELDEAARRHCEWFTSLAERAEPMINGHRDQARWLHALDAEHGNLSAAFEWAVDNDPERALRLAGSLSRYFSMQHIAEGRQWTRRALDRGPGSSKSRARALTSLGVLARMQGDLVTAASCLEDARALAEHLGDQKDLVTATILLGNVAEDRAEYGVATARYEDAVGLATEAADERGRGHALNGMGVIALRSEDHDLAADRFMEALGLFRSLDDPWSIAVTATNMGWIAETAGELAEAATWYEECRQLRILVADDHGLARSAADLGRVSRLRRELPRARERMEEALHGFHRLGDRRLAAACLLELAAIAMERGRRDIAARLVGAAESVRAALGTPAWPDEVDLESGIVEALAEEMGKGPLRRARQVGRSLSLDDAVDMVDSDSWPPTYGGGRLAR